MIEHYSAVVGHIVVGSAALGCYWVALLSTKGSPRHRAWGRALLLILVAVCVSVGPLLLSRTGSGGAETIQFVYLTVCVLAISLLAWTAIRWKHDLQRFRGWHFKLLGIVLFALGLVVLAGGIASARALTVLFSWIGLVYGAAMIRFAWMRAAPQPTWWLGWHLNAVCGLFNAVHGTFLALAWRRLVDPGAGDDVAIMMQLATIVGGLALRIAVGRSRGVPLRLSMPIGPRPAAA
ncbi:MAG: hypothetical protein AB7G13_06210 [Lautropia sp.]